MPSADQVKALISSLTQGDEGHFYSVAMQIAAHEARMGHGKLAEEIRTLIDKANDVVVVASDAPILARPRGEVGRTGQRLPVRTSTSRIWFWDV